MKTANIYQDIRWNEHKPVSTVLFETGFTKEIRIAMQKGTLMKEHKTSYPIVVEILEGLIDFGVKQETKSLTKGDLITLEGNMPHNLRAKENSIVRLTLTKYDKTNRVEALLRSKTGKNGK
ncbi:MAG: cupin domain-containing protein [Bacteroidota bacterium]